MAEHKIGSIVTLPDGRKAEIVEQLPSYTNCRGCIFALSDWQSECSCGTIKECAAEFRTDHKNMIYKEKKEK